APLRMVVPETLADMRQFQPGVNKYSLAMRRSDHISEVNILFFTVFKIVPRGDVETRDPCFAPLRRQIVQIHPAPISAIEECPEPVGPEGRFQAQIRQCVEEIRKAFVSALARRSSNPENCPATALQPGAHRRAVPALLGEYPRALRQIVIWEFQTFFPY